MVNNMYRLYRLSTNANEVAWYHSSRNPEKRLKEHYLYETASPERLLYSFRSLYQKSFSELKSNCTP